MSLNEKGVDNGSRLPSVDLLERLRDDWQTLEKEADRLRRLKYIDSHSPAYNKVYAANEAEARYVIALKEAFPALVERIRKAEARADSLQAGLDEIVDMVGEDPSTAILALKAENERLAALCEAKEEPSA